MFFFARAIPSSADQGRPNSAAGRIFIISEAEKAADATLAFLAGLDAIAAGADMVLVSGVEVQTTCSARVGGDYLARAAHYRRQRDIDDFTFPALFARRMRAYRQAFDVSEEDIGRVAVKAYGNANRNPLAHMHSRKVTLEWARDVNDRNHAFLANEELNPFMKVSDCSQVSDGASALLLVSEEGLQKLGRPASSCAEVIGWGNAVSSLYTDGDPTRMSSVAHAAQQAYDRAGITAADVDICELHDCFTIAEIQAYEAVGLAAPGRGAALVREGHTAIDGRIPVNTGGGLIGFGHPVGATGIKQPLEIFRQMKGRCGDYQVAGSPSLGLTSNMGGDDKTAVSLVLQNCG